MPVVNAKTICKLKHSEKNEVSGVLISKVISVFYISSFRLLQNVREQTPLVTILAK